MGNYSDKLIKILRVKKETALYEGNTIMVV